MTEPRAPYRHSTRPAPSDPAVLAASVTFQTPATPSPTVTLAETTGQDRAALVSRLVGSPVDWRSLALLLLDSKGADALTDAALLTMVAIVDALEYKPAQENEPC